MHRSIQIPYNEVRYIEKETVNDMTYYNNTDKCEICEKDFHGKAYREKLNGKETGKWVCSTCYRQIKNYGTTDADTI